jgi:hypothetical protein
MYKKEKAAMVTDDEIIEVFFDKTRINPHRGTKTEKLLKDTGSVKIRFIKFKFANGEDEYFITNLNIAEFAKKEIIELYKYRWGIETVYDTLKNKFQIENFTGQKSIIIEQDIYSTIYLCNIAHDFIRDTEKELTEKGKSYKYEMAVNKNIAIGIIKEELLKALLMKNKKRKLKYLKK